MHAGEPDLADIVGSARIGDVARTPQVLAKEGAPLVDGDRLARHRDVRIVGTVGIFRGLRNHPTELTVSQTPTK